MFELELVKLRLLEVPLDKIATVKLPPAPKVDGIDSQFGTCGASDLREAIAAEHETIAEVREEAESVSRLLPLSSSWQGLLGRAQMVVGIEEANRDIIGRFVDLAAKAKLTPTEVGSLEDEVGSSRSMPTRRPAAGSMRWLRPSSWRR